VCRRWMAMLWMTTWQGDVAVAAFVRLLLLIKLTLALSSTFLRS
jgi:hypothetical protein